MYSTETKHSFIELRAQGLSLERIAQQLGINKSTALDWHRRFKSDIAELKAFRLEAIRERVATKYEDEFEYASSLLKHIRTLLRTRGLDLMSTNSLYYAEEMAYRRVRQLGALAELPDAPSGQSSVGRDGAPPPSDLSEPEKPNQNPTVSPPESGGPITTGSG
jgi:transposase